MPSRAKKEHWTGPNDCEVMNSYLFVRTRTAANIEPYSLQSFARKQSRRGTVRHKMSGIASKHHYWPLRARRPTQYTDYEWPSQRRKCSLSVIRTSRPRRTVCLWPQTLLTRLSLRGRHLLLMKMWFRRWRTWMQGWTQENHLNKELKIWH